ncbi:two-component system, OmpR family, sensor histidine kinase BaeS [Actinosynnema pretiosum]|nr:two-component system, OmpR family, sensor histidine kinase BaeS [Actinosynnema pretiosum]
MRTGRRHSLLVRISAMSALIAACSIAVTAWLASQATTGAIRQEQGEALSVDARIYDELLGFAATHPGWDGVESTVDRLAAETGRRVALTTPSRAVLADSGGPGAPELPVNPKVQVDPLTVNAVLKPDGGGQIDPRAVGPFALGEKVLARLEARLEHVRRCSSVVVRRLPSGRPWVAESVVSPWTSAAPDGVDGADPAFPCDALGVNVPLEEELPALADLEARVTGCLARTSSKQDQAVLRLLAKRDAGWYLRDEVVLEQEWSACVLASRKEQLAAHVAAPALLFLTAPTGGEPQPIDLSTAGAARIAVTGAGILVVAGLASWGTATAVVRPVRALTAAARRMTGGDRAVRVREPSGEVGELAGAFNALSERLAEVERQRKAMVSDVAHELRTPLANITGWLEAAQDGLAEPDPALIAMLLEEAFLLQHMVDDLRDLAQADAGALRLHREPVDAAELVAQTVAAHRVAAGAQGVRLEVACAGGLVLHGDPVRLRQVLGNLVGNAVRHTPSGGSVVVRGRGGGGVVVLEVVDTGEGLAEEDLARVFDRFWRADPSRNRATGGSGLGLAISRHLVELHGGSVTAESEPGVGSVFRVVLPVGDADV